MFGRQKQMLALRLVFGYLHIFVIDILFYYDIINGKMGGEAYYVDRR